MNLSLPGEQKAYHLTFKDGRLLTLTNYRVRYEKKTWGASQTTSIMLEEVASCSMTRNSMPLLLVLAGLAAAGGAILFAISRDKSAGPLVIGLALAVLLTVFYFLTRQGLLAIGSAGATIRILTAGMDARTLVGFIDTTEAVKNQRYLMLAANYNYPTAAAGDGTGGSEFVTE